MQDVREAHEHRDAEADGDRQYEGGLSEQSAVRRVVGGHLRDFNGSLRRSLA
jgi:hypothetical protein